MVAIPSNRVNVSYLLSRFALERTYYVAIPSNRVNVSYKDIGKVRFKPNRCRNPLKSGQCFLRVYNYMGITQLFDEVAIPSNRVNVSYRLVDTGKELKINLVAIPSNRVNVSYLRG